jgi:hypothetical protein
MSSTTVGASMRRVHPITGRSGLGGNVPHQSVRPSDLVWTHRSRWRCSSGWSDLADIWSDLADMMTIGRSPEKATTAVNPHVVPMARPEHRKRGRGL